MRDNSDDRSPIARAASWSSKILTVTLEMVLPGLFGYWLDKQLGTRFVLMLLGFAVGSVGSVFHLLKMTAQDQKPKEGSSVGQRKRGASVDSQND